MSKVIGLVTVLFCLLSISRSPAYAVEPCPNLKSMEDVYEALNSKERITVLRGLKCGLLSDDRGARGLVIFKYLSDQINPGAASINITVDVSPSDKDAAGILPDLPNFSIWSVHWSPEGHQFSGTATFCCQTAAAGNLIGDTLTISYQNWPVPDKDRTKKVSTTCSLSLMPNEERTALEGPLRCQGLPYRFRASIGL